MPSPLTPAPPPETEIQPPGVPGLSGLLTLAVGVVVLAGLYVGREVFLPVVLAILLAFVLAPFVDVMRRWHLGRVPAVIIAVLLALGIIVSLGGLIGFQVAGLASDMPRYQTTIETKVGTIREGALGKLPSLLRDFGRRFDQAVAEKPSEEAAPPASAVAEPPAPEEPKPLPVEVHEPEPTPAQVARNFLLPLLEPLATMGIVFVVLIFILMQREDLRDRMIRLFGSSDLHRTTAAMDDAARRLSRYFLTQLALNASFGLVAGIGLWAIGVPSPALWGVFAALMRFVPYIGSFLAAAPPILLAAAVDPGWSMALMAFALFAIGEPLMGHVVEPIVYGQSTGLSPFAVVISAIFWTWIWGPVGLLIATPLTLCLVVLGRHVERLEFLDVLLGDRPALTPAENLYQRMLAGDPDEALDSAEVLLKERSLTSYYDEVALKGLQLAANDATRGVLTHRQLDQVRDVIKALVADLGSHDDVEPPPHETKDDPVAPPKSEKPDIKEPAVVGEMPHEDKISEAWRTDGAVMCIAGRGPLDEAASEMLAQLLNKHGLGSRLVPHEAVSRSAIFNLDMSGVQMICISYLEISGTPAHLRYLLRRLRKQAPKAPIVVGLWPAEDAVLKSETMRSTLGADYYVSSMRDAVVQCLKVATGEEDLPQTVTTKQAANESEAGKRLPLPA
ncbi:AI-2E family transporter [Microvirga guangxiensis]|uniref:Predicted PurR-regulated permease PerM n=1 Tax=Microvirga guangxiensis TaxID=549386 RepID=A0A1G5GW71_9HYPH|nr:AI-2E family transporter [Microvirga guangxiensis]SCY55734.1 Predicted PurR-regulated permease PerM [Microvirga guangxiensis]